VRDRYLQALAAVDWLQPCPFRPDAGPNVAAMPVRLAADAPLDAEALCAALLPHGVHARAYFAGGYRVRGLRRAGRTPVADEVAGRIVCLPFWGRLAEHEIARVADALTAVARRPVHTG
jgi:dTDP-4-amino-4,6-dideoxygalactose transaminase